MSELIQRTLTTLFLITALVLLFLHATPFVFTFTFAFILGRILTTEWPLLCNSMPHLWLLIPLYPVLPFTLFILLNESVYRPLLFILFITVAAHDIGSYVVGKLYGRYRLAPFISPGKTWEGAFGGFLSVGLCLYVITYINHIHLPFAQIFFLSSIISLLALAGDLFESWLKRKAYIKDMGNILPGHGGLLDRFDSSMFVVFYFYALRDYLSSILF